MYVYGPRKYICPTKEIIIYSLFFSLYSIKLLISIIKLIAILIAILELIEIFIVILELILKIRALLCYCNGNLWTKHTGEYVRAHPFCEYLKSDSVPVAVKGGEGGAVAGERQ